MALRNYNPKTPGTRQLVLVDRSSLYKGKPLKALTEGKNQSGGRNATGRLAHGNVLDGGEERLAGRKHLFELKLAGCRQRHGWWRFERSSRVTEAVQGRDQHLDVGLGVGDRDLGLDSLGRRRGAHVRSASRQPGSR